MKKLYFLLIVIAVLGYTPLFFLQPSQMVTTPTKTNVSVVPTEGKQEVLKNCKDMIASYEIYALMYEGYNESEDPKEQQMSQRAKIEANTIAHTYNKYLETNRSVFGNTLPQDIWTRMEDVS